VKHPDNVKDWIMSIGYHIKLAGRKNNITYYYTHIMDTLQVMMI